MPIITQSTNTELRNSTGKDDYIELNTAPTSVPTTEGTLSWNATDHTLNIQSEIADSVLQVGQEFWLRAVNKTGVEITDGQCVYVSGAQGNRPKISLAKGDAEATSYVIGVATAHIANNAEGYVTLMGRVGGYNTSEFTAGDFLYISPTTAGALTNVKPTAPNHAVKVAIALNSTNNGSIYVNPEIGYELSELHDVLITSPANNDFLQYYSTGGYWRNVNSPTFGGAVTFQAGTAALPSITTVGDTNTGIYFPAADTVAVTTGGTERVRVTSTGNLLIGTTTDYFNIEADGTDVRYGAATQWDDVYPSSVTVGVGATAPTFSAYSGNLKAYEFTGSVSNKELHIGFQIYHSYKEGSNISPHIHLYIPNNGVGGTIIFDMEYDWANVDDTGAITTTTLTGTLTLPADSTIRKNVIFSFNGTGSPGGTSTPITGTGKKISSVFMTRLVRRQDLDTFAGSVWLKSADIHIEKDMIGSRQTLIK